MTLTKKQEAVIMLIESIREEKEQQNKVPTHALKAEMIMAITSTVRELFSMGIVEIGDTVNDKFVKVKK